ncbi:hypothetical protein V8C86DRAFT_2457817 [Haematococcus lacustris]
MALLPLAVALTALALFALANMLYQAFKAGAWAQLRVSESILGPFLCLYQESEGPLRAQQVSGLVNLLVDAGLVHCSNRRSVRILYLRQAPPGSPPATTDKTYVSYVFKHTHQLSSPEDVAKYRQWLSHLSIVKSGDVKVGLLPAALCLRLQLPFARNYDWSAWVVTWRALPSLAQAAAQRQPNNIQGQGCMALHEPESQILTVAMPVTKSCSWT